MSLLASTRPYEGLLISLPALAVLGWRIARMSRSFEVLRRTIPAALVLLSTFVFLGYYNYRVAGSPLTPPYQVNRSEYASAPYFLWQSERPQLVYRHTVMRRFHEGPGELGWFLKSRTLTGLLEVEISKPAYGLFFLGFALLPALALLPYALRDRRIRFVFVTAGLLACGLAAETFLLPHYIAPFTAGIFAIVLQCMRHLEFLPGARRNSGRFLVRAMPAICVLFSIAYVCTGLVTGKPQFEPGFSRASIQSALERKPGEQLAIVRYQPNHTPPAEWVYNAADVDGSKVVWAREMDPANNLGLLRNFKDRTAWLVEPDFDPPRVSPYPKLESSKINNAMTSQ